MNYDMDERYGERGMSRKQKQVRGMSRKQKQVWRKRPRTDIAMDARR